ncbi:MAG: ABC transporter ATP-binding protein, partial [Acidimicrobiales bacterium]
PSLGLAPLITASLMAVLADLCKSGDITILLVEQNARSALSIASWAIVLNLGTVVVSDVAATVAGDSELRHHFLGF